MRKADVVHGASRRIARIVVFQRPETVLYAIGHELNIRHPADEIVPVVALYGRAGVVYLIYPVPFHAESVASSPYLHAIAESGRAELPSLDDAASQPVDHAVAHGYVPAHPGAAHAMRAGQRQMKILYGYAVALQPKAMPMLSNLDSTEANARIAMVAAQF